jgi:hypothetical protein
MPTSKDYGVGELAVVEGIHRFYEAYCPYIYQVVLVVGCSVILFYYYY